MFLTRFIYHFLNNGTVLSEVVNMFELRTCGLRYFSSTNFNSNRHMSTYFFLLLSPLSLKTFHIKIIKSDDFHKNDTSNSVSTKY